MDRDAYFLEVCRYVDLNPVRASMVRHPRDWRWSSYRVHVGQSAALSYLDSVALHSQLAPRAPRRDGPKAYAVFVAEGKGVRLWENSLRAQIYLGSEAFVERMQERIERSEDVEVPRAQRKRKSESLSWYLERYERNQAIAEAYSDGGHTQTAIAAATGLSLSRVSRIISGREAEAIVKT